MLNTASTLSRPRSAQKGRRPGRTIEVKDFAEARRKAKCFEGAGYRLDDAYFQIYDNAYGFIYSDDTERVELRVPSRSGEALYWEIVYVDRNGLWQRYDCLPQQSERDLKQAKRRCENHYGQAVTRPTLFPDR